MFSRFIVSSRIASAATPACIFTPLACANTKAKAATPSKNTTAAPKAAWSTIEGKTASLSKAELDFFRARKKYLEAEQAVSDATKEVQTARRRVTFIQALVDAQSKK
eukprot:TRINITY_DN21275_c0_g1_i1.p3 TRINITY_DN21275_c0_g1~~TRINITY_DN21275_c0_g1_i1.p3  ORF type:complete len:107 (-),score=52.21 TRINITY_DN21275_c0_g1_i1:3-323(-)